MIEGDKQISRRDMLRWGLSSTMTLALTSSVLTACGGGSASVSGNSTTSSKAKVGSSGIRGSKGSEITLKFASSMPTHTENAHTIWFDKFVRELVKKTNGKVGAIFYGDSQLGPEDNYPKQVQSGAIDMMTGPSVWASIVPQVGVLTMGFLFNSMDELGKAVDGKAGKILEHIFDSKAKAEILGWPYNFGGRNVLSKRAITKPGDFHGVKLRVLPSPTFVETFKLLGAVPVPMSMGEVYTALQTGTIEGLEHDAPTILQNKFYEIAKNLTLTYHIYDPLTPTISKVTLGKLSSAERQALRKAAQEAVIYQRPKAKQAAAKAMSELKGKGVTFHNIDRAKLRQEVKPLWTRFTDKYPETKPVLKAIEAVVGYS
ncbi:MAG: TRAP transporter substrate-binding protein [Rubrobacteraceae bacterium]|nr:TRAP transporter substrate-binding protein [Rubrobacteraceae bacterium]